MSDLLVVGASLAAATVAVLLAAMVGSALSARFGVPRDQTVRPKG